eukprot:scaffold45133_cov42-Phaeocystis_antarctica.AAC.3
MHLGNPNPNPNVLTMHTPAHGGELGEPDLSLGPLAHVAPRLVRTEPRLGRRRAWMRTAACSVLICASASPAVTAAAAAAAAAFWGETSSPPSPPRRPPRPEETRWMRFGTDRPSGGIAGCCPPARAASKRVSGLKAASALAAPLEAPGSESRRSMDGLLCAEEGVKRGAGMGCPGGASPA